MIKNVIFDIGMVLVNFRWREYMRDDLGFSEELVELMGRKVVVNPLWDELDLGIREATDIIADMKAQVPEYPQEAQRFFDGIEDIVETYSYSLSWIEELKARGYKVYLLSNYPRDTFTLHSKRKFNFVDAVDGKIVSGFVRLAKPDPAIYQLLLDTYRLNANECVFIDDRENNIEAAQQQGMKAILFKDYESARNQLNRVL